MYMPSNNSETHAAGSPDRRKSLPYESSIWAPAHPQFQRHFSLDSNLSMLEEQTATPGDSSSPPVSSMMSPPFSCFGNSPSQTVADHFDYSLMRGSDDHTLSDGFMNGYNYSNFQRDGKRMQFEEEVRFRNQNSFGFGNTMFDSGLGPGSTGSMQPGHLVQNFAGVSPTSQIQAMNFFAGTSGANQYPNPVYNQASVSSAVSSSNAMMFPYCNSKAHSISAPSTTKDFSAMGHGSWMKSPERSFSDLHGIGMRNTAAHFGRISPTSFADPRFQVKIHSQDSGIPQDASDLRRYSHSDASRVGHFTGALQSSQSKDKKREERAASQQLSKVDGYFVDDVHQRVSITLEYLEKRMAEEGVYLSASGALPRFPQEESLYEKHLVLVAFKAGRLDVFTLSKDGLQLAGLQSGDLVIVEADRGRDLGKVMKIGISVDEAKVLKMLQCLEQQAALTEKSVNDLSLKSFCIGSHHSAGAPGTDSGSLNLHCPKEIVSLAQESEVNQILTKRQDEEKACRLSLGKISSMACGSHEDDDAGGSPCKQMELVDAEYQFDRKKLIFYYSTNRRRDFRELVRDLFRIYKTRIWMCAVSGIPYNAGNPKRRSRSSRQSSRDDLHSRGERKNSNASGSGSVANVQRRASNFDAASHSVDVMQAFANGNPWRSDVPRKFQSIDAGDNFDFRENGENFVLKSLVESINH